MSPTPSVLAVAEALVPLEFRGFRGMRDETLLEDAATFTSRLLSQADTRVTKPLQSVVLALDSASLARFGMRFTSVDPHRQARLWWSMRDKPGFAQLRQVVRTAALMRLSEWEGFIDGTS